MTIDLTEVSRCRGQPERPESLRWRKGPKARVWACVEKVPVESLSQWRGGRNYGETRTAFWDGRSMALSARA